MEIENQLNFTSHTHKIVQMTIMCMFFSSEQKKCQYCYTFTICFSKIFQGVFRTRGIDKIKNKVRIFLYKTCSKNSMLFLLRKCVLIAFILFTNLKVFAKTCTDYLNLRCMQITCQFDIFECNDKMKNDIPLNNTIGVHSEFDDFFWVQNKNQRIYWEM